jgi:anion-transporting  ArsA/GET3 family ATPase
MIDQRFIIVAGKGGVGRTTLAAALASCFARKNLRTLLASADAHEKNLGRIFGRPIGTQRTRVSENLEVVHIKPMDSIKEYALMLLKLRYLQQLLTGTRVMQSFVANIPGIAEWAVMGKVTYHLIEKHNGRYLYDRVILDAPPTGHSLSLIKIPGYIAEVVRTGPLNAVATERLRLVTDPLTTGILVVTIPEEMAVSEALDMNDAITRDLGVPVLGALVNRTIAPLFTPEEQRALRDLAARAPRSDAVRAAQFRVSRTGLQARQVERISKSMPVTIIPDLGPGRMDLDAIETLSGILEKKLCP